MIKGDSVWAVLKRFGGVDVVEELNGNQVHRLGNILTLSVNLHYFFDTLHLWLEATVSGIASIRPQSYLLISQDIINQYEVCTTDPAVLDDNLPRLATFTSTHPDLHLPDPRYLKWHAACCKVANLSGVGAYIGSLDQRMEEADVLASDGTSADLLSFALSRADVRQRENTPGP